VPTSRRREREKLERREAILDAAARVFSDKGLLAATMDEIAAEAELSKGALYLYFKNKDELYLAHAARTLDELGDRLHQELGRGLSGVDSLRALLLAYARFAEENPRDFANGMQWVLAGNDVDPQTPSFEAHSSCVGRILGAFIGAVARGQGDGTLRPELEPAQTGARLWCALIGALIVRNNTARMTRSLPAELPLKDTSRLVPELVEILCRGVSAAPEATAVPSRTSKRRP
jgi:TetR/AcrR family transcriptional regulator